MLYALDMTSIDSSKQPSLSCEPESEAYQDAKNTMPSAELLNALADLYKIMGDPTRLKLLLSLEKADFCASELADLCEMSRSAVSHQLKTLKAAKLVKSTRNGKSMIYSLDDDHVHDILKVAFAHVQENENIQ